MIRKILSTIFLFIMIIFFLAGSIGLVKSFGDIFADNSYNILLLAFPLTYFWKKLAKQIDRAWTRKNNLN